MNRAEWHGIGQVAILDEAFWTGLTLINLSRISQNGTFYSATPLCSVLLIKIVPNDVVYSFQA